MFHKLKGLEFMQEHPFTPLTREFYFSKMEETHFSITGAKVGNPNAKIRLSL